MAESLNFLLDTNVLIAAYPTDLGSVETDSDLAVELIRQANEHGHSTYSHPVAVQYDVGNIEDREVRTWRELLIAKHPHLQFPPPIQPAISSECGEPKHGSNDWVDHHLLAAVVGNAVDFLVTEDRGVLKKGRRLGLGERVVDIEDAIAVIKVLAPRPSSPLLLARQVQAQVLDERSPFFDSLREDYSGFDDWLAKSKREHRDAWVIEAGGELAAATIVKHETPADFNIEGQTLKIAMFKVSEGHSGLRYGELLLKSVFDFLSSNYYESAYVTVLPKHDRVISFFEEFGFERIRTQSGLGEAVLVKSLVPRPDDPLPALEYHVRYGPQHYRTDAPAFIVPIKPKYHRILFPESEAQRQFEQMRESRPFGNSILKAYLSGSSTRSITSGSILYFYRSGDKRGLTVVGIAEQTLVASSANRIAAFVGKRTVYSRNEIEEMTANERDVLAVLFRQARTIESPIRAKRLTDARVWSRPPQSIMRIPEGGVDWIQSQMERTAR